MDQPRSDASAPDAPARPDGDAADSGAASGDTASGDAADGGATDSDAADGGAASGDAARSAADGGAADDDAADDGEPVGNPLRWASFTVAAAGAALAFLVMTMNARFTLDIAVVGLGIAIAAAGLLDALGTFDDPEATVTARADGRRFWPRLVELVAATFSTVLSLRLAVAGGLPFHVASAAALVTGASLWSLVAAYRVGEALGIWPAGDRPLLARHGAWVVAGTTLINLPLLGSASLIDPWETHYGEVAREMLARSDWITLWWAQEELFFSKPVLDFWIQGISFSLLGVGVAPDQMLAGASRGLLPQPEWAARLPIFLFALVAVYVLYAGVAKVYGRLTGLLAAAVLGGLPYWFLVGRQSMTDLPYVAPLTAALGLLLIAFHADPDEVVRVYELRVGSRHLRLSAYHLLFGVILCIALPQVLYLLSRNVTWHVVGPQPFTMSVHGDYYVVGSGLGNCGLPGNDPCKSHWPFNRSFQPALGALVWGVCGGVLLTVKRAERRVQRLAFIGAWLAVALSALAKGAPGLVIPLFVVGAFIVATGRYRDLLRMELGALLLLFACVTLPWYVQSYMRHGMPFLDRLLFHDMYKRAFVHVHDTNEGVDVGFRYYLWQLGYGLFPFTGLGAAGFLFWMRRDQPRGDPRAQANILLGLWFLATFSLFTLSLTKFHHYIFPAVPPLAVFSAVVLERSLDTTRLPRGWPLAGYLALSLLSVMAAVWGMTTLLGGTLVGTPGAPTLSVAAGVGGLVAVAALGLMVRTMIAVGCCRSSRAEDLHTSVMLGGLALFAAACVALVGRDLLVSVPNDVEGQARLFHLFIYNYDRAWPQNQDFRGALAAFVLLATLLSLAGIARAWRTHAATLFVCLGLVWAAWGANAYFTRAAQHWGQRETILEYYRRRTSPAELLVAYQLNWKGENFYTSNRLPAFVSDPQGFAKWIAEEKRNGTEVMFFTTELKRVDRLEKALGNVERFELVTSEELCNKFALVRVVF